MSLTVATKQCSMYYNPQNQKGCAGFWFEPSESCVDSSWSSAFDKVWDDDQCANIRIGGYQADLKACQNECERTPGCTAINWSPRSGPQGNVPWCNLRNCSLPVHDPTGEAFSEYVGYRMQHLAAH